MNHKTHKLNKNAVYFNQLNDLYQEVSTRMLEKIEFIKLVPNIILNLSHGSMIDTKLLKQRYPKASIYNVDKIKQQQKSILHKIFYKNRSLINANYYKLPFSNNTFDMVWSNLLLPYIDNIKLLLQEAKRVLKPNGILLLSGFGVDSLNEIREYKLLTNNFPDLHVIGDLLYQLNFQEPVTDVDFIRYNNQSFAKIIKLLRHIGGGNLEHKYLNKNDYLRLTDSLDKNIYLRIEIFYAYAIKPSDTLMPYIMIKPIK